MKLAVTFLIFCSASASAFTKGGEPPNLSGRPTDVHDGDTFRFGRTRIRVFGIDAPELNTAYGPGARSALVAAIGDGTVRCRDTGARSYGRVVASCINARGADLARDVVQAGWAVDWWSYSCGAYLRDQQAAQHERRGMFASGIPAWRQRSPVARACGPSYSYAHFGKFNDDRRSGRGVE